MADARRTLASRTRTLAIRGRSRALRRRPLLLLAAAIVSLGAAGAGRELVRESFSLDHLSSDWEILLPDPDEVYPTGGRLRVVPALASDWNAISQIPNLVRYRFPLVGSDLDVRATVSLAVDSPGHGAALVLYQDDRDWVELALRGERAGGGLERVLRLTRMLGGELETLERNHGHGPSPRSEQITLILERRGDRFRGRMEIPMGPPGVVRRGSVGELRAPGFGDLQLILKAVRTEPPPSGAGPGAVDFDGVVAVGRSADAALAPAPATLRVAYATDFRDPAAFRRDFSVLRPDPGSLVLENGLELVARYGIPGDSWTPIRNLVVRNEPLPNASYDVEVELEARFTSRHDDVGIVLYGEKGNALYLGHWALPGGGADTRQAYLRTLENGRGATRFSPDAGSRSGVEATTLVFRIEHEGQGYTGWVDVAGRGWVKVGQANLSLMEPRIGLFARSARDLGSVPGAGVRVGRLWVMTEEPAP